MGYTFNPFTGKFDYYQAGITSIADLTTKDHDLLDGLSDDDHTQYHNDTRGDARYAIRTGGTALSDNCVVRGNSTTGIQGSAVSIDDNGTINLPISQALEINSINAIRLVENASTDSIFIGAAGNPGNETGRGNIVVGEGSGASLTSGYWNVFIGADSAASATTQNQCFALGYKSAYQCTGTGFFAIGALALEVSSGSANTALGHFALRKCTTGPYNTAIGNSALGDLLTGTSNMAVGGSAGLGGRTTASYNTFVGVSAGSGIGMDNFPVTANNYNTAIGYRACSSNFAITFATEKNVIIGADAANSCAYDQSVLVGYKCATNRSANTTKSSNNVIVGNEAFSALTTASTSLTGMVVMGYQAGPATNPAANVANELWVNNAQSDTPLIFGYFSAHASGPMVRFNGDTQINSDSYKLWFGAGQDSTIYYDGTDLIINSDDVGSGGCKINTLNVRADGTIQPVQLADASAANDSIYYSTTQSKLVYKDSGGTVNNLY